MKKEELLTTCFGLGKLPFCPGTWGSLPPVVLYQVLRYVPGEMFPAATVITMVVLLVAFSWICIRYAPAVIAATGKKDPQMIVADEVAGQALTMLVIALLNPGNICNTAVLGFALFRLFDILKPWPCKQLEKLPTGVGILADDLMAGVYGGIVASILIYYIPVCFG
ncbi:MAG: phosphatidylglycerophosphatase A family protein [Planctomycetota bacterium]|jgi:phosphatidylglycerophosphatase A